MSSVAEQLRRAREAQGLSLRNLAESTKIRADRLEALEEANYDPFPAPVYIRGSVRTYASCLGLDVPAILAELDAELAQSPEFSSPPSLTGGHRGPLDWVTYQLSRVNWRVTLVLAGIALFITVVFYAWRACVADRVREDPLGRLGPGMYQSSNSASEADVLSIPATRAPRTNGSAPR